LTIRPGYTKISFDIVLKGYEEEEYLFTPHHRELAHQAARQAWKRKEKVASEPDS